MMQYVDFGPLKTLEIAPKLAFSGRYENFEFIPDGT